ncbi:MAG: TaqI-like C-terminal specificity domain-containing protein, partial [Rhabdochlamydiaceae bacterium]
DERLDNEYKEAAKKLRTKKIVVQNIVSSKVHAVATWDNEACLDIDTITNVLVTDKSIEPKYVLGLMNSKLMTFYIRDVVFNRALLTMHMDAPYLGQIPIKRVPKSKQKELVDMVDSIINMERRSAEIGYDLYTSSEYVSLQEQIKAKNQEIDRFAYDLYGLNSNEIETIERLIDYW